MSKLGLLTLLSHDSLLTNAKLLFGYLVLLPVPVSNLGLNSSERCFFGFLILNSSLVHLDDFLLDLILSLLDERPLEPLFEQHHGLLLPMNFLQLLSLAFLQAF